MAQETTDMQPWRNADNFRQEEFSPAERQRLRRLLEDDERIHRTVEADERAMWFWRTIRVWVMWIGGIAVALTAIMTLGKDLLKFLTGTR